MRISGVKKRTKALAPRLMWLRRRHPAEAGQLSASPASVTGQ